MSADRKFIFDPCGIPKVTTPEGLVEMSAEEQKKYLEAMGHESGEFVEKTAVYNEITHGPEEASEG